MRMAFFTVVGAIVGFILSVALAAMSEHYGGMRWPGGKLGGWGFVIVGTAAVTCFARWLGEKRPSPSGQHTDKQS